MPRPHTVTDAAKHDAILVDAPQGGSRQKGKRRNALSEPRLGYINTRTGEFQYKPSEWSAFLMKAPTYIQARTLNRIVVLSGSENPGEYHVLVHFPSQKSHRIGCDACATVHRPRNKRCSANGTPGFSALRDNPDDTMFQKWDQSMPPKKFDLLIKEHLRGRKVARGVLILL